MGRRLKILMISARADFGGGPEHLYRLISLLNERHDIYAAIPDEKPYYDLICGLIGRERVYVIPHRKFTISHLAGLKKFIDTNNISVIHSHGKGAGTYSRPLTLLTKAVCVHTYHGIHIDKYGTLGAKLFILLDRIFARLTAQFIAAPGEYREAEKRKLADINKINIISNGVIIPYMPVNFPVTDSFNILHITRFDEAKNPFLLAEIGAELKNITEPGKIVINVVGEGKEKEELQKKLAANGCEGFFRFHEPTSNIAAHYLNSACYLSTSMKEGMPLSVIEAMSYGIPCVVTDVTGNNDLITENETGFLYKLDEPRKAAQQIVRLSQDENLWSKLSIVSRAAAVERFNFKDRALEIEKVYFMAIMK